jgi:methionine aminotransferase
MIPIYSKLPNVGTNIFTIMSGLAVEHAAINLGQGFPDFPMDERLHEAVYRAMRDGFNQYAPMAGHLPLRESIAEKIFLTYGHTPDPASDITVTPGGTYAIYTALTSILQPGDEVIVFEPCYDSYIPNIEVNGAFAVRIPLTLPEYRINWDAVKANINPKTRAIIINSPHNPTGRMLSADDMETLDMITRETRIMIISDEVYEHMVYDGRSHESVLKHPKLRERSFACFSFGKVYHCTGWKMGYCIAPKSLMTEFRKIHQFNAFSCNTPQQVALAEFLKDQASYVELGPLLQQKRDLFIQLMKTTRFNLQQVEGSYFMCATYHQISDASDMEFAMRLTRDTGVAVIPLSAFYQDKPDTKTIRFCFCKKTETLEKAASKLSGL